MRFHANRAFTLIEVLIVVVVLGILASVVMAMVSLNQDEPRRVSAATNAQQVQTAIELYRQSTGNLPDLIGAGWSSLTEPTTVDGRTVGPFLYGAARNPVASGDQSLVVDAAGEVDASTCAFAYDYQGGQGTGRFLAAKKLATP